MHDDKNLDPRDVGEAQSSEPESKGKQWKDSRRGFIQKCLAASGGALVYFAPRVNAYAANPALSPGFIFDVTLPSFYSFSGQIVTLSFAIPGAGTFPVDFIASGGYSLVDSGAPPPECIANCIIDSINLTSVSSEPLAGAGILCGSLTAANLGGPVLAATLDLITGTYTPVAGGVSLLLDSSSCGGGFETVDITSGIVQQLSAIVGGGSSKACECFNGNDVDVAVTAVPTSPLSGTNVRGTVGVRISPVIGSR